jgi:hypothetical protein
MIRRDFILRQLEQFAAMLAKIAGLAKNEQWQEASAATGGELQRLAGVDVQALLRLSETALLARLIESEPALAVESKIFMLATLLKTQGDVLAGQGRADESRKFYLKGLHLLFETFGQIDASERPDFVPTIEAFLTALREAPLPVTTNAMLMHHYERIGEFARAEDALFEILDAEPSQPGLLEFGRMFYQRLLRLDDQALASGNLPRTEAQSGLAELDGRKSRLG